MEEQRGLTMGGAVEKGGGSECQHTTMHLNELLKRRKLTITENKKMPAWFYALMWGLRANPSNSHSCIECSSPQMSLIQSSRGTMQETVKAP